MRNSTLDSLSLRCLLDRKCVVEYMNLLFKRESLVRGIILEVINMKVYSPEIGYHHIGSEYG